MVSHTNINMSWKAASQSLETGDVHFCFLCRLKLCQKPIIQILTSPNLPVPAMNDRDVTAVRAVDEGDMAGS